MKGKPTNWYPKLTTAIRTTTILAVITALILTGTIPKAQAWGNGGYSDDPEYPDYGTHDWIAQRALDWLPAKEKEYLTDNLAIYIYGTELPDNRDAPDGIGDTTKHHVYYYSDGSLQDDVAADRAQEEYLLALTYLIEEDHPNAAKRAGVMVHYISDLAVFGHVMGSGTDWGAEDRHSEFESYIGRRTESYDDEYEAYISFDGTLDNITAYNATLELAYDTTFDPDGSLGCVWMDQNYDWNDPAYQDRTKESVNLAVNYVADVLHTLYIASVPRQAPCNIEIRVTDEEGTELDGAAVSSASQPTGQDPLAGTTDEDGMVAFANVEEGSYDFTIQKSDYEDGTVSTTASPGETVELTVTLVSEPIETDNNGIPGFPTWAVTMGILLGACLLGASKFR